MSQAGIIALMSIGQFGSWAYPVYALTRTSITLTEVGDVDGQKSGYMLVTGAAAPWGMLIIFYHNLVGIYRAS